MVKVSENVVEEEPLSQTRVDMTNTKNKALVECANKNSRRLICLTNQLQILHRAANKVFSWCLSSTPIPLLLIDTQLPLLKITLNLFEYQFFELWISSTFMLLACSAPPPRIPLPQHPWLKISDQPVKQYVYPPVNNILYLSFDLPSAPWRVAQLLGFCKVPLLLHALEGVE